jgi:hypothetical protein
MASQAAGDSVNFGAVSGGKIIGAGGGPGSIIGETVEVNGPVIHIHNLTEEGARTLRDILHVSPEVPAAPASAAPAGASGTTMHAGIDEMLRLMKAYARRGISALQVDAGTNGGAVQFSAVDLLLRKAVLLVSEANALTVAANRPDRAEAASRMDQAALGEMLAGFDGDGARATLAEALDVLRQARELAPESTAVMLQMAQVLGRLHADGTREERDLLDEVLRRVATPSTDEQRLHRAQAMYLLGTLGRNRDVDLLREAREQFVRLGRVDWMRQCDQTLAAAEALPNRDRRSVGAAPPSSSSSLGRLARRLGYGVAAVLVLFAGGYALLVKSVMDARSPDLRTVDTSLMQSMGGASAGEFQPAGTWQVAYVDGKGPTLTLNMAADGTLRGTTYIPNVGKVDLAGRWFYDKDLQVYTLDLVGNGTPLGLMAYEVTQWETGGFIGVSTGGDTYRFTRQ